MSTLTREKTRDVFEDEPRGLLGVEDTDDIPEELSTVVLESEPLPCDGVGLAGKSSDEKIEVWQGCGVDPGDVSTLAVVGKVVAIDGRGVLVDLRESDALVAEGLQRNLEPANAGEGGEVRQMW